MNARRHSRARVVAMACAIGLMVVWFAPGDAGAHTGHPQLSTTSCNDSGCGSAVFAICEPNPMQACTGPEADGETMGPRTVTLGLHGFSANTTVHLWWLKTAVANPASTDCRQAGVTTRTDLGDVTTDGNGDATTSLALPPGEQGDEWEYGPNWVCATTAPHAGGSGEIADGLFTVYPA